MSAEYLDDWIGTQLIADLTERVGRLLWFPAIVFLLLLVARNEWWDCWPWQAPYVVVMTLNLVMALASMVILQRAARAAKSVAEERLAAKLKRLEAQTAPSATQRDASQAAELLKEIQGLRRGAFVPFWENPVVGALFLSSGGTAALQVLMWSIGR